MHLTRSLADASIYAVMGLYRKSSFGGKRKVGLGKAELAVNHPLQDVNGNEFVERVRSGKPAQNLLDVGGHETQENGVSEENRAQKSGDVGVRYVR